MIHYTTDLLAQVSVITGKFKQRIGMRYSNP